MSLISPRARWWLTRILAGTAILIVMALAIAAAVHTPPVRRAVLRRAVTLIEERFSLSLEASSLRYNLLALRVSLDDVRLAAASSPRAPFFAADTVELSVPRSALFGRFVLDAVRANTVRVTVVRRVDGTTNLPSGSGEDNGSPPELPINRIVIRQLALSVTDDANDLALTLPALSLDIGREEGTLQLQVAGNLRRVATTTSIERMGGGVAFDGRVLNLARLALATSELDVQIDGRLALLVDEPRADLQYSGNADIAGLARWGTAAPPPTGRVAFEGQVEGPFASPAATARLYDGTVTFDPITLSDVSARLGMNGQRLEVAEFGAAFAGGRLVGAGELPLGPGDAALSASWRDLDVAALVRTFAPGTDVVPVGKATGDATARGPLSDVRSWTLAAATELAPGRSARGQVAVSGKASLGLDDGAWRVDSTSLVAGTPAQVRLRGQLDTGGIENSTVGGTVTVQRSDISRLLESLRTVGLIDLPPDDRIAGGVEMETALFGTLANPRLQITAHGSEISAAGVTDLTADLTAEGPVRQLSFEARLRQGTGNIVVGTGTGWPAEARLDARFTGTLNEPAQLMAAAPVDGIVHFQVDAAGRFDALRARGTAVVDEARYDGFRIGRLDASIEVDPTAAQVTVASDEFATRARAGLALDDARFAIVDVQVDEADLARVVRDAELPVPVSGRVSLRAHGEGSLDGWRQGTARLEVSRLDAVTGELPIRFTGPARLAYEAETLDVESLDAAVGDTHVSVAGRLAAFPSAAPVAAADALRATLVGDVAHAIGAVRATGLVEVPDVQVDGPLVLLARVAGSAERPIVAADLEYGPGQLAVSAGSAPADTPEDTAAPRPAYSVEALRLRAHLEEGVVDLLSASAEWQGSQVSAEGRMPLSLMEEYLPAAFGDAASAATGPAVLSARARSVTPRVIAPFVSPSALDQIEGSVDASAELSTTSLRLEDLEGEIRLDQLDVRAGGLPIAQREPTRIVFGDGFARVASWDWTGKGATLAVQGQVRLEDRQAALRAAGRLDLQMLMPFVRDAGLTTSGTLMPLVAVSGPLDDPVINAEITLANGGLRLAQPRVIATGLTAKTVVSQVGAQLTALGGSVNGGALSGSGQAIYGGAEPWTAGVDLDIAGMALEFPQGLRSELDANLRFALKDAGDAPAGNLSGTVTVLRGAYREPIAVVTGLLAALRSERLAATGPREDSLADRLALDVRVVTDTDVIVDNNLARLQLGGDLRVIGTAAAPALSGRAELREGGELFLGRNRYSIDSGTIDFENPLTVEPDMNVQARTRAGGVEIELTLKGTPETLSVDLRAPSSDEALGQADLASLLLTGRKLEDVSGDEGRIVGEQVVSYLSGDLFGAASRVVGLDTIRFGGVEETLRRDPAAIASETDPTSRMTFGKSLGDFLEVTLSQSLRDADAQTWIVDYRALPQLTLRLVSGDDHLRGYEFRHDVSFGPSVTGTTEVVRSRPPVVPVADVVFDGETGLAEEELRRVLRLAPGDTFDFTEWQRDRDRLEQLLHERGRREARVDASRREDAAGITLAYGIEAGPPTAIMVTGYALPRDTQDALGAAWTQAVFDDFLVEEASDIVRRALAEHGYLQPEISATIANDATKTLAIAIVPGQRITGRRIAVATADESLAQDLERWIRDERLADTAWRDRDALDRAMTAYLQGQGRLTASVAVAPPSLEGRVATIVATVEPGPVFTMGELQFTGAASVPLGALRESAELPGGAPYDVAAVTEARSRVLARYRREGFADARVTVAQTIDPAASRVNLAFGIEEGRRQVLRDVSVAGNRAIDTEVIERALDLAVGEPLGADAWLQARSRLFDTALFRRVDVTTVPIDDAPATEAERAVRVQAVVQEWPALRLRYGFQVSEERPEDEVEGRDLVPGFSADLTRRTFFGKALTAGAVLQYQRRDQGGRLFANAPTLFGLPIESLVTVHRSRQEFVSTTLLTDRAGVSWEQRMRIRPDLRVSYSYAFDRDHTFETEPDPDSLFPEFDVTVNVARLNAAAVLDTRDDPLDSTRGLLLSSSVDYSSEAIGSGVSFVSHLAQAYYFRPWRQVVFASAVRLGTAVPLGGQPLIPSERFRGGGSRTVRGVREEGLGPRDFEGGALGGGALVVVNQEVRFPIFRWFRGVGFVDAGNVFETPAAIDLRRIAGSIGAGLRLTTPFALLRVDYGRVFTETGRTDGRWTFGIGQAF